MWACTTCAPLQNEGCLTCGVAAVHRPLQAPSMLLVRRAYVLEGSNIPE